MSNVVSYECGTKEKANYEKDDLDLLYLSYQVLKFPRKVTKFSEKKVEFRSPRSVPK